MKYGEREKEEGGGRKMRSTEGRRLGAGKSDVSREGWRRLREEQGVTGGV